MDNENEKIVLEEKIRLLRREYKSISDEAEVFRKEIANMADIKVANQAFIDSQKDELREITNQIANEKLSWSVEKAAEEKKLEGKKSEVEKVLQKEQEFAASEAKIIEERKKNEEVLKNIRAIESSNQSKIIENEAVLRAIQNEKAALFAKEKEIEDKKIAFDIKLRNLLNDHING